MRLHPTHGVNPSLMLCYFCGQPSGVALLGANRGQEAPRQGVYDMEPCPKCEALMKDGIILISVRDGDAAHEPYRTGNMVVVTEEAIRRIVTPTGLADELIRKRVAFVPDAVWVKLDLPTVEVERGKKA